MALTVPDIQSITNASNGYDFQSVVDSTDLAAITAAENGTGVVSGMTVSWLSAFNASVTAGTYLIGGNVYTYAGGSVAATGASVSDRRDIVTINSSGTLTVTAGTPCGTTGWLRTNTSALPPVKPAIPASNCLLGEIGVPGGASALAAICFVDKTTPVSQATLGAIMTATQTVQATAPTAITQLNMPLQASTNYRFEAELYGTNSASGSTGICVAIAVPAGAVLTYDVIGNTNSTATKVSNFVTTTTNQNGFITTSGFTGFIKVAGAVIMSTATGSLQVQFGSQTGSTTAHGTATMNIGSNLVVNQI